MIRVITDITCSPRSHATSRPAAETCAAIADAGTMTGSRYSRSEVRFVPAVDVKALREMADSAAKAYRELDTKIQQLNWTTQLQ